MDKNVHTSSKGHRHLQIGRNAAIEVEAGNREGGVDIVIEKAEDARLEIGKDQVGKVTLPSPQKD